MKRRDFSIAAAAAVAATQFGVCCAARTRSSFGTVKMMIPANPGGGWDQTGRALATAMQSAKTVQIGAVRKQRRRRRHDRSRAVRQQREGRSERADDGRHGDGRRHRAEQVAGRFDDGDADRAADQRVSGRRGAGQFAVQDDGRSRQGVQGRSGQGVVERRVGRWHRSHPGRPDRAGGRRRTRTRSITLPRKAAAIRSQRSSAATSARALRASASLQNTSRAGVCVRWRCRGRARSTAFRP